MSKPDVQPPIPNCPHCHGSEGRWLSFTSSANKTNTFQCLSCGHVWTAEPGGRASSTSDPSTSRRPAV